MNNPLDKVRASVPAVANEAALVDRRYKNPKPRRITAAIKKVVRLLLDGECRTIKAAGKQAGLTPEYLSRALRQPHVLAYIDERTRTYLAEGKMAAASRLMDLVHAKSEHVSFDASRHALAINGIKPPEEGRGVSINIQNNIAAGYVVDNSPWAPVGLNDPAASQSNPGRVIVRGAPMIENSQSVDPSNIRPAGLQFPD